MRTHTLNSGIYVLLLIIISPKNEPGSEYLTCFRGFLNKSNVLPESEPLYMGTVVCILRVLLGKLVCLFLVENASRAMISEWVWDVLIHDTRLVGKRHKTSPSYFFA